MSWWKKRASNIKRAVAALFGLQKKRLTVHVSAEDTKAAEHIIAELSPEARHQVDLVMNHLSAVERSLINRAMKNEGLNEQILSHLEETDRKAAALIQRFQGISLVTLRGQVSSESLKSEFTFDKNFQGMNAQDYARLQASMNSISSNIKKHFDQADVILRSESKGLPKDAEEILDEIHGLHDKFRNHAAAWSTHAGQVSAPLQHFIASSRKINDILKRLKREAIELNRLNGQIGKAAEQGAVDYSKHKEQMANVALVNKTIKDADDLFRECNKGIRHITQDLRRQLRYDSREARYGKRILGKILTLGQRKVCRFSDEDKKKITADVSKQLDEGRAEIDRILEDIKKKYLAELEQHDKCINLRDWVNRQIRKSIEQCVDIENGVEALHKQLGKDLKELARVYKDEEKAIHDIEKAEVKAEKDLVTKIERDQKET